LSPEVLLLSPQGYFSKDLKISSSFRIATSTTLFPDRYGFRLKLHADTAFSIDLSSETDGTVTFSSSAVVPGLNEIEIPLFNQVGVLNEIAGNLASTSVTFKFTNKKPDQIPKFIVAKAQVEDSSGLVFETNKTVIFSSEPDPYADTSIPALISSRPQSGDTNVGISSIISFSFNKPIDTASFKKAFSISPGIDLVNTSFVWNQNQTYVEIKPPTDLLEQTSYKMVLSPELKDQEGNGLRQEIIIGFTTSEGGIPQIQSFYPTSETALPINGSLQFLFNEEIVANSFRITISPVTAYSAQISGKFARISPVTSWSSFTDYQVVVAGGLADLAGNTNNNEQTFSFGTSDQIFPTIKSFYPENGFSAASVTTFIEISFDQAMNQSLTQNNITFSQNFPARTFLWKDEKNLRISFAEALENSGQYEMSVSDKAESQSGQKLANDYFYWFKTMSRPELVLSKVQPVPGSVNVSTSTLIILPFTRPMDKIKTQQCFSLTDESGEISKGSFSWNLDALEFAPATPLKPGRKYRVSLNKAAQDIYGNQLAADFEFVFTTVANQLVRVVSYSPVSEATEIAFDEPVEIFFSGPIDTESLIYSINPPVPGTANKIWSNNNQQLKIIFDAGFSSNTRYEFSISNDTLDANGQKIAIADPLVFTTATFQFPRIISATPASGSSDILANTGFSIEFDQPMNVESVQSALSLDPAVSAAMNYTWKNSNRVVDISFEELLQFSTLYHLNVFSTAKNSDGISLSGNFSIPFTTKAQTYINQVFPASGSTDISADTTINISFSDSIDTLQAENLFQVSIDGAAVSGNYTWQADSMIFTPSSPLPYGKKIVFYFAPGLVDSNGLPAKESEIYSFTTLSSESPGITNSSPADGQVDVAYNLEPWFEFSTKMATETVSFTISPAVAQFNPVWSEDGKTLTLKGIIFSGSTSYQITFSTESESAAGSKLVGNNEISFTTAPTSGLVVESSNPSSGAENTPIRTEIKIDFNSALDKTSFAQSISLIPSRSYNISFLNDDKTAVLTFVEPLEFSTGYNLSLSADLKNQLGQNLNQPYAISFTTESAPSVTAVDPAGSATNITLNQPINITFSKSMNTESVENAFRLSQGLSEISCSFSWQNNNTLLTCLPSELLPGQKYNISLGLSATDINGNSLSEIFSSSFTTLPPPEFIVEFIDPENGFTQAPTSQTIIASFSNPVDTSALSISFTPAPTSGYSKNWSSDGKILTIVPTVPLVGDQTYQVTINSSSKDIYGSELGQVYQLSFTTIPPAAPEITQTIPEAGSFDVPLDQKIILVFSNQMNPISVQNAFSMTPEIDGSKSYSWSTDFKTLEISFSTNLTDGTSYSLKVASNAFDVNSIALGFDYLLPFKTIERPVLEISTLVPAPDETGVAIQTPIIMNFSKLMDLSSIQNAFSLQKNSLSLSGTFSANEKQVTFTPDSLLDYDSLYDLSLSSLAKDTEGNFIKAPYNWSFSTTAEQGKIWRLDVADTTAASHFSSRVEHVMLQFNSKLILIGGFDGEFHNDVWTSDNGIDWTNVLPTSANPGSTQFQQRAGHACAVFNNRIWLTGGYADTVLGRVYYDDVWSSADGITWQQENSSAEYYKRAYHNLVVFDNKLWIIAGETPDPQDNLVLLDDCWSSENGINWQLRSNITSFFPRKSCGSAVVGGKLWVWGGYGQDSQGNIGPLNDGWYTTSGDLWVLSNSANDFTPRCGMAISEFSQKIWMIGGIESPETINAKRFNDVWTTNDGILWYQILPDEAGNSNHFSPRSFLQAAPLTDRLFISGGERSDGLTNEIWSTAK
jgi:N-acetylneuraminic acid mutarotase